MVSNLFWFRLDFNSLAFPQYLFLYHIPASGQKILHEELFKLPWRRLSLYLFTSQNQWATSLAHLWCWIHPGINLNQPTLPCQGNAEARGLHHPDCYCSNLPWHGFDPLQGALGSGTACPVFGTGQGLSPVSSLDAAAPYQGWKILGVRMGPALLSWLHGQSGSWKCLISW